MRRKVAKNRYGVSAAHVMSQYPIARFNGSAIAAFVQADSDKVVIVMAYIVMAYIVMAYMVMVYLVMA